MKFSLVLLLIVFHFFTCLAQNFDSVNIQAHTPNASELLREKAFLEGKKIYFKPDWFNNITLKDDNTGDSLEMVLNKLLPPLDLKYVEFPPNHFVIV